MGKLALLGRGVGGVSKLRKLITLSLFTFIFGIVFIGAVIDSIKERTFEPLIVEVGGRVFAVTHNLKTDSLEIIKNQGVYDPDDGFFTRSWSIIKTYAGLVSDLLIMWILLKFFIFIATTFLTGDRAKVGPNFLVGLVLFFGSQVVFVMFAYGPDKFMAPFSAFLDFGRALPHIISPIAEIAGDFAGDPLINETEI